jgi:hypothetical protein
MGVLMSRDWQVVCLENTRAVSSNEQCVISFSIQNFSIQSAFASLDGRLLAVTSSTALIAGASATNAPPLEQPQCPQRSPHLPRAPYYCYPTLTRSTRYFFEPDIPKTPKLIAKPRNRTPNMLVPQLADLKARINDLIIKSTSLSSSPPSPSTTPSNNTRNDSAPRPKYPIKKPLMHLFPEAQAPLSTIKVVTKHSHAFNSSAAAGLGKLGQLQFAEVVKRWIIGTWCPLHMQFRDGKNRSEEE